MLRGLFDKVATPLLTLCCVTVTTLALKQYFFPPAPRAPEIPTQAVKGRLLPDSAQIGIGSLRIGAKDAPFQLTEFADFECPFCSVAARQIHELRAKHPGAISVTFRHLLIPGHTHSPLAALAAECAGDQGAFERYYELLFQHYSKLTERTVRALAKEAGVARMSDFDTCIANNRYASRIDADTLAARMAGLGGTPSWIVGDSIYGGILANSQLEAWVTSAMSRQLTTNSAR
jgi:protein-disulfide isomerase